MTSSPNSNTKNFITPRKLKILLPDNSPMVVSEPTSQEYLAILDSSVRVKVGLASQAESQLLKEETYRLLIESIPLESHFNEQNSEFDHFKSERLLSILDSVFTPKPGNYLKIVKGASDVESQIRLLGDEDLSNKGKTLLAKINPEISYFGVKADLETFNYKKAIGDNILVSPIDKVSEPYVSLLEFEFYNGDLPAIFWQQSLNFLEAFLTQGVSSNIEIL